AAAAAGPAGVLRHLPRTRPGRLRGHRRQPALRQHPADRRLHPALPLTIRRPPVPRTMIMGSFGRYVVETVRDHELGRSGVRRICRLRGPWTPSTRISSMSLVAEGPE